MTNKKLTAEELEALKAVDVMSQPPRPTEEVELDRRINELEISKIILKVAPNVFDKLNRVAEFKGITIEEYCSEVVKESLNVSVGAPTITSPSRLGGVEMKKVTAPTYQVSRG